MVACALKNSNVSGSFAANRFSGNSSAPVCFQFGFQSRWMRKRERELDNSTEVESLRK